MKVSLIATERNEAGAIEEFLDSVLAQTTPPDEIVIADAASNDGTTEIIQRYIDRAKPIVLLNVPGNRSVGRNAAIAAATHEVIAVADVGCRLAPDWLEQITKPFRDQAATAMVAGNFEAEPKSYFERISTDVMLAGNHTIDIKTWLPSSRSIAFTKTAWEKAGRYPEYREFSQRLQLKCGGEDTLFDLALKDAGYEFADGLAAVVYWRPRPDFTSFYLQYYWYAVGDGMDLTGLADHPLFYRLTLRYAGVVLAVVFGSVMALGFGPWWGLVSLGALVWLSYGLLRRCYGAWKKHRTVQAAALMMVLLAAFDVSQIFGYWYGFMHRPAKHLRRGGRA